MGEIESKYKTVKVLVVFSSLILCLILAIVVNMYYGIEVIYTHFFYIPIILCGIWFFQKAYWVAALLGMIHILINTYAGVWLSISSIFRSVMFLVIAGVVCTLSLKKEEFQKKLISREKELRELNESMLDIISRVNLSGVIEYISSSVRHVLGYTVNEVLKMNFLDLVHPDDKEFVKKEFNIAVKTKKSTRMEYRCLHKDGSCIWVETVANPINDGSDILEVFVFGSRDITQRKEAEEKLLKLSTHDTLTGLKNRTYLNSMLNDIERTQNVAVFSIDIDGLKYVNDIFGHLEGDKLIIAVSDILKKSFGEKDTVIRVGGDEYLVIVPECSYEVAEMLKQRVLGEVVKYNKTVEKEYLKVSISIGYSLELNEKTNLDELYRRADANMYLDKKNKRGVK